MVTADGLTRGAVITNFSHVLVGLADESRDTAGCILICGCFILIFIFLCSLTESSVVRNLSLVAWQHPRTTHRADHPHLTPPTPQLLNSHSVVFLSLQVWPSKNFSSVSVINQSINQKNANNRFDSTLYSSIDYIGKY